MDYQGLIKQYYEHRDQDNLYERQWGYVNSTTACWYRLRDELVFEAVLSHFDTLNNPPRVLEIGVGHGHELAKFSLLGIPQENLVGIDLVSGRLDWAKSIYPNINFYQGNATNLVFTDNSFDIVCQFTCAMHMPSKESQILLCQEMLRVLKPGGIIIWWDLAPPRRRSKIINKILNRILNPSFSLIYFTQILSFIKLYVYKKSTILPKKTTDNPSVDSKNNYNPTYSLPISREDIIEMFSCQKKQCISAGVDYPLWAFIWQRNRILASFLWRTAWFSQHCFAVIEKEDYDNHEVV